MGQSSPRPSILFLLKSLGPNLNDILPQWLVRPPSILARHQSQCVPSVVVNGSPSICHPQNDPSKSPNGLNLVLAPRLGDSHAFFNCEEFFAGSYIGPASNKHTFKPAFANT